MMRVPPLLYVFVIVVASGLCVVQSQSCTYVSVTMDGSSGFVVHSGKAVSGSVAWACYEDSINRTGWSTLRIHTSATASDADQARGAGYLEGWLTHERMSQYLATFDVIEDQFRQQDPKLSAAVDTWVHEWSVWAEDMADKEMRHDSYWQQVYLVFQQLRAMLSGYNDKAEKPITWDRLVRLNSGTDVMDLVNALSNTSSADSWDRWFSMTTTQVHAAMAKRSHCSAFIRVTPDSDVLTGHTTWGQYLGMLRVYKITEFHFADHGTHRVSFSSYPGLLASGDDFYVMDSGLTVIETTLQVFNQSLYEQPFKPEQRVLTWMRTVVSNRMARNASMWVDTFGRFNSGTYNNAWMVVDYNRVQADAATLQPWSLGYLEQMPGMVESIDMTPVLRDQAYWASYNIPWFHNVWLAAGYGEMEKKQGPQWAYASAPRAFLFARNHSDVVDVKSMQRLMQWNDYKVDPLSHGDPAKAIASRFDLEPLSSERMAMGGIDSKVTSTLLQAQVTAVAISGPTHQSLGPFVWSATNFTDPRFGQPDVWNFDWVTMRYVA